MMFLMLKSKIKLKKEKLDYIWSENSEIVDFCMFTHIKTVSKLVTQFASLCQGGVAQRSCD